MTFNYTSRTSFLQRLTLEKGTQISGSPKAGGPRRARGWGKWGACRATGSSCLEVQRGQVYPACTVVPTVHHLSHLCITFSTCPHLSHLCVVFPTCPCLYALQYLAPPVYYLCGAPPATAKWDKQLRKAAASFARTGHFPSEQLTEGSIQWAKTPTAQPRNKATGTAKHAPHPAPITQAQAEGGVSRKRGGPERAQWKGEGWRVGITGASGPLGSAYQSVGFSSSGSDSRGLHHRP